MELVGTDKRPVYWIQPEMLFNPDCKIAYAQISENGLWVEFYSSSEAGVVKEFEFPLIFVNSMRQAYRKKR